MHTLFDSITFVKGVEYLIALACIAAYMIYWEALKPKPFKSMVTTAKEDREYRRELGQGSTMKTIRKIATAPFVGLAYIAALPAAFLFALGVAAVNGLLSLAGKEASFGWRPVEAYLTGRKKRKEENKEHEKKEEK